MKKLVGLFLIVTSFAMCAFTCEESENDEYVVSLSPIVSTTLPATGKVNVNLKFTVSHGATNGCARYAHNVTTTDGQDVYVTFYTQYPKNAYCTMNAPVLETEYSYKPAAVGEYTFHFKQSDGVYHTQKITISE